MKRTYIKPETTRQDSVGSLLLEQLPVSGSGVDHGEAHSRDDFDEEEEEIIAAMMEDENQSLLW